MFSKAVCDCLSISPSTSFFLSKNKEPLQTGRRTERKIQINAFVFLFNSNTRFGGPLLKHVRSPRQRGAYFHVSAPSFSFFPGALFLVLCLTFGTVSQKKKKLGEMRNKRIIPKRKRRTGLSLAMSGIVK